MRLALFSDVHSNRHALDAVLEHAARFEIDAFVILGDLVGYNAEPQYVVDRIRSLEKAFVVGGNHDREIANYDPENGHYRESRHAHGWNAKSLDDESRDYLRRLPPLVATEEWVAIHGSFMSNTFITGYVTGSMLSDNLQAIRAREHWPRLAFCGHTHVPMLGWLEADATHEPKWRGSQSWPSRAETVLVNPGSVGQPRDGDPRASYAILDTQERHAELHRIAYDVEGAMKAILGSGLDPSLAARLSDGV